jgi:hypothetical protein
MLLFLLLVMRNERLVIGFVNVVGDEKLNIGTGTLQVIDFSSASSLLWKQLTQKVAI